MGAGINQAAGINRVHPELLNIAFIGDSTFFHAGVPGVINAVYNQANIIVAVLDNRTTAMTGGQPHPGMGRTLQGDVVPQVSIYDICKAIGVANIERVNCFDFPASKAAVERAAEIKGVKVIIFEGACVTLVKGKKSPCVIDASKCTGCASCVKKLGCPALSLKDDNGKKQAVIDPNMCTGCGLCANVCPTSAIGNT
jgi:indolepyruvate ferredoxin oxidoreductase alpha subunit